MIFRPFEYVCLDHYWSLQINPLKRSELKTISEDSSCPEASQHPTHNSF